MWDKTLVGAALVASTLVLGGCGGSTTTVEQTETQGQQLMDLKEAYDKGVITEKEYEKTKKQILKGN
ncbi:SHOCT domain-containing protein [Parahaliea maris]|uniref:SHOCT domain-containing protein n=1 Tax=Parahaliea maris TaxID=2716870 RepID=A0A5C9A3N6_9GAMM|nr:SHOCT domain-containing protein [Parahaliea maris]TXS94237.1 SHOCT domain-containing protein [Parahaliea maris]